MTDMILNIVQDVKNRKKLLNIHNKRCDSTLGLAYDTAHNSP